MAKKNKTLCDWTKKDIEKNIESLAEIVADPRYVCRKCARAAHTKKYLCKAVPLKSLESTEKS